MNFKTGPPANRRCSARFEGWVFPKADVIALPIDNSTAEQLARWFAERIRAQLEERGATNITSLAVGIEEMPGQAGWYRED